MKEKKVVKRKTIDISFLHSVQGRGGCGICNYWPPKAPYISFPGCSGYCLTVLESGSEDQGGWRVASFGGYEGESVPNLSASF